MWTFYNSSGEALVQHAESEATQAEMEGETAWLNSCHLTL